MHAISVKKTYNTEEDHRQLNIKYLKDQNILVLKGWSIKPELNAVYRSILKEIKEHLTEKEGLTIYLAYELFHTTTIQFIFNMIKVLNKAYKEGKKVKINWITKVENQELFDTGLELRAFCSFDFLIQPA